MIFERDEEAQIMSAEMRSIMAGRALNSRSPQQMAAVTTPCGLRSLDSTLGLITISQRRFIGVAARTGLAQGLSGFSLQVSLRSTALVQLDKGK